MRPSTTEAAWRSAVLSPESTGNAISMFVAWPTIRKSYPHWRSLRQPLPKACLVFCAFPVVLQKQRETLSEFFGTARLVWGD